jgi:hypothetical protein
MLALGECVGDPGLPATAHAARGGRGVNGPRSSWLKPGPVPPKTHKLSPTKYLSTSGKDFYPLQVPLRVDASTSIAKRVDGADSRAVGKRWEAVAGPVRARAPHLPAC